MLNPDKIVAGNKSASGFRRTEMQSQNIQIYEQINSDERSIKKDILKLKEIELKEFGDSFLWDLV